MIDNRGREAWHSRSAALRGFVERVSSEFCPFIEPARKHEVLSFSDYTSAELIEAGQGSIVAGLLYVGIVHTERLRRRRAELRNSGQVTAAALICDNIVLLDSEDEQWRAVKDIVDWPHYLLKSVYSDAGVMFGKFWTREERASLDGRTIPTTPATFLSIRSAVRRRDPILLRGQVAFATPISQAADNGHDVLKQRAGIAGATATVESLAGRGCFDVLKASTGIQREIESKIMATTTNPLRLDDIPDWLRAHLEILGSELRLEQLSSRRGVTTLTAAGDSVKLLVKLAETTADGAASNSAGVQREAAVLSSVDSLRRRFEPTLLQNNDDVALVESWIEGTPAFRDVRALAEAGNEATVIELLRRTLQALDVLHAQGWAHGDLQPQHFLLADGGSVLLDYGAAQSATLPMADYRGGMVHFNAPEVAADIISHGSAAATPSGDVFSLGAVFAFAVLGRVIGDYEMSVPWDDKLLALACGRLRTDLLRAALTTSPRLLDILLMLLDVDPTVRPHNAGGAMQLLPAS